MRPTSLIVREDAGDLLSALHIHVLGDDGTALLSATISSSTARDTPDPPEEPGTIGRAPLFYALPIRWVTRRLFPVPALIQGYLRYPGATRCRVCSHA